MFIIPDIPPMINLIALLLAVPAICLAPTGVFTYAAAYILLEKKHKRASKIVEYLGHGQLGLSALICIFAGGLIALFQWLSAVGTLWIQIF